MKEHQPEDPFDRWLSRKLRDMYGAVVDEPLPEELVDLIKQHETRKKGAKKTPE